MAKHARGLLLGRYPGKAVVNLYEVRRPDCMQFWIMRPGVKIKISQHQ